MRPGASAAIGTAGLAALAAALALACNAQPSIVPLAGRDCPEGASVVGRAAAGDLQRCELPGGIRHGKSRAWYDNGRLRYETEWWQGKKHGAFTLWYASGRKRAEGRDRDGIPDGTWTAWAEDGTVLQHQVFPASGADRASSPGSRGATASPGRPEPPGGLGAISGPPTRSERPGSVAARPR